MPSLSRAGVRPARRSAVRREGGDAGCGARNGLRSACGDVAQRVCGGEGLSARRRLGLRPENHACGACLTMPAFAGVGRTPCADQGRHRGWPIRQWRNPANADGDACGAVFDLARVIRTGEQRAVRIAPPRRQAFTALSRVSAQQPPHASAAAGQGRGAMRAGRCDSSEKPPAGVPIGGGAALVPSVADHAVIQPIPYRPADDPNRSRHREAHAGRRFFRP
jgi:hypothetical protein